jgi:hypothetical protein
LFAPVNEMLQQFMLCGGGYFYIHVREIAHPAGYAQLIGQLFGSSPVKHSLHFAFYNEADGLHEAKLKNYSFEKFVAGVVRFVIKSFRGRITKHKGPGADGPISIKKA